MGTAASWRPVTRLAQAVAAAADLVGPDRAQWMVHAAPTAIIEGAPLPDPPPISPRLGSQESSAEHDLAVALDLRERVRSRFTHQPNATSPNRVAHGTAGWSGPSLPVTGARATRCPSSGTSW